MWERPEDEAARFVVKVTGLSPMMYCVRDLKRGEFVGDDTDVFKQAKSWCQEYNSGARSNPNDASTSEGSSDVGATG